MVEQRPADLEERRELELGLRLNSQRRDDLHVLGARDRVLEQRRLSDSRFAPQHQGAAPASARLREQLVDARALALTADQHPSNASPVAERRQRRR
jgi:hypothetical protein